MFVGYDIELYLTHNEGKSVFAEIFILTLIRTKFINEWFQNNVYIDKLADINKLLVNKYNNSYHITIKIKLADVKSGTYVDFNKENNKEDPKC